MGSRLRALVQSIRETMVVTRWRIVEQTSARIVYCAICIVVIMMLKRELVHHCQPSMLVILAARGVGPPLAE